MDFFERKFLSLNPNEEDRKVYVHQTCATDTENIKIVDVIVQDVIMNSILSSVMIDWF